MDFEVKYIRERYGYTFRVILLIHVCVCVKYHMQVAFSGSNYYMNKIWYYLINVKKYILDFRVL